MNDIIKEEYIGVDRDICGCGDESEMYMVRYADGSRELQHREPSKPKPTTFETMESLI